MGLPHGDVVGFKDVTTESDQALMSALRQQSVFIAIEADQSFFQFYKKCVITAMCETKLDHGVLAVGYGTEFGEIFGEAAAGALHQTPAREG